MIDLTTAEGRQEWINRMWEVMQDEHYANSKILNGILDTLASLLRIAR